jgi:group I intron endonuclease
MAVYKILNTITRRIYVGSAINVTRRWTEHRRYLIVGKHHSQKLQRSWNKYGSEAFIFEIIEVVAEKEHLIVREQYWITSLHAACHRRGMNILPTAGSHLGAKRSPQARARISAAIKKRGPRPWSAERRAAYIPHNKGATLSLEERKAIGDRQRGKKHKPHSTETKEKLSIAAKRRGIPAETIRLANEATRGRTQSAEERAMRSAAHLVPAIRERMRQVALQRWATGDLALKRKKS